MHHQRGNTHTHVNNVAGVSVHLSIVGTHEQKNTLPLCRRHCASCMLQCGPSATNTTILGHHEPRSRRIPGKAAAPMQPLEGPTIDIACNLFWCLSRFYTKACIYLVAPAGRYLRAPLALHSRSWDQGHFDFTLVVALVGGLPVMR